MKISKKVIERASHYVCCDDNSVEKQIELIAEHSDENDNIDEVEGVTVWSPVVDYFTCKDFLEHISYGEADNSIDEARETLREAGFAVDNLWCNDDVKAVVNVKDGEPTDEACQGILNGALKNDATMEQIWLAIKIHAENEGFDLKED